MGVKRICVSMSSIDYDALNARYREWVFKNLGVKPMSELTLSAYIILTLNKMWSGKHESN